MDIRGTIFSETVSLGEHLLGFCFHLTFVRSVIVAGVDFFITAKTVNWRGFSSWPSSFVCVCDFFGLHFINIGLTVLEICASSSGRKLGCQRTKLVYLYRSFSVENASNILFV